MGVESLQLWRKIFINKRQEYINLCKLASMVVSLSSSNSSVKQAFRLLTLMLSNKRLRMKHTLQDIMSININGKLRTPQEREELIDCAFQNFLSKRRMKKAVEPPAKNPRIEPDVSIKDSSDSSDNGTDSSFEDTENNSETDGDNDAETD